MVMLTPRHTDAWLEPYLNMHVDMFVFRGLSDLVSISKYDIGLINSIKKVVFGNNDYDQSQGLPLIRTIDISFCAEEKYSIPLNISVYHKTKILNMFDKYSPRLRDKGIDVDVIKNNGFYSNVVPDITPSIDLYDGMFVISISDSDRKHFNSYISGITNVQYIQDGFHKKIYCSVTDNSTAAIIKFIGENTVTVCDAITDFLSIFTKQSFKPLEFHHTIVDDTLTITINDTPHSFPKTSHNGLDLLDTYPEQTQIDRSEIVKHIEYPHMSEKETITARVLSKQFGRGILYGENTYQYALRYCMSSGKFPLVIYGNRKSLINISAYINDEYPSVSQCMLTCGRSKIKIDQMSSFKPGYSIYFVPLDQNEPILHKIYDWFSIGYPRHALMQISSNAITKGGKLLFQHNIIVFHNTFIICNTTNVLSSVGDLYSIYEYTAAINDEWLSYEKFKDLFINSNNYRQWDAKFKMVCDIPVIEHAYSGSKIHFV